MIIAVISFFLAAAESAVEGLHGLGKLVLPLDEFESSRGRPVG